MALGGLAMASVALLLLLVFSGVAWLSPRWGRASQDDSSQQSNLPKLQLAREFETPGPVAALLWSADGTKLAAANLAGC
jgi:hypothetical protein